MIKPANAEARRLLALNYVTLGKVYQNRAANRKSVDERRTALNEAKASFQRSLEIWLQMREQGQLSAVDAGKADEVGKDIAQCDAALAE